MVELVSKAQVLRLLLKSCPQCWRGLASKQEVLELQIFSGALYPSCLDVAGALPAVPVGGGDAVEVCATQVERPVAGVTHQGVGVICGQGLLAGGAGGCFQQQLPWSQGCGSFPAGG